MTTINIGQTSRVPWQQCGHVCGNIKLITKNSEKERREKGKKKGF